jgi:hypothetical protein
MNKMKGSFSSRSEGEKKRVVIKTTSRKKRSVASASNMEFLGDVAVTITVELVFIEVDLAQVVENQYIGPVLLRMNQSLVK